MDTLLTPIAARNAIDQIFEEKHIAEQLKGFKIPTFLVNTLKKFIEEKIFQRYEKLLQQYIYKTNENLYEEMKNMNDDKLNEIYSMFLEDNYHSIQYIFPINYSFLSSFTNFILSRCEKAIIQPGSTVGAVAAQSIGEPATQMTLKSFHFAGVASMNVSMGVPRIQEVMNAIKDIKTPIITAKLYEAHNEIAATVAMGKVNRILLK